MLRGLQDRYYWWLVILAASTLITFDLVGAITTPDYDFWRDTVSHQMRPDVSYSNFMRAALFSYSLLLVPFALQARKLFVARRWWRVLVATGIWAHVGLMVVAGLFQNDSTASILGLATVNTVHDVGSIALFTAAELTLLAAVLSSSSTGRILHGVHARLSLMLLLSMGLILIVAATTEFNGITERVNTAAFMGWLVMTARVKDITPVFPAIADKSGDLNSL